MHVRICENKREAERKKKKARIVLQQRRRQLGGINIKSTERVKVSLRKKKSGKTKTMTAKATFGRHFR